MNELKTDRKSAEIAKKMTQFWSNLPVFEIEKQVKRCQKRP